MKLFAFLVLGEPKNPFLKRYHFTANPGGPADHTGSNISVVTHIEYGKDRKLERENITTTSSYSFPSGVKNINMLLLNSFRQSLLQIFHLLF
jgi:hypothetical protein